MSTNRLGKGLEALIRPFEEMSSQTDTVSLIPLTKIEANPNQPRKDGLDAISLEELTASIKEKGVITPITVQKKDDHFLLVAGERRWRASQLAGLKSIPAYVINVTDKAELMELALIENIQRENLNAIEEAEAYEILQTEYHLNQTEIAKALGKSRVAIANSIRLLQLSSDIKGSVRKGEISAGHGRAILLMKTKNAQQNLWQKIKRESLSVRASENIAKLLNEKINVTQKSKTKKKTPFVTSFENEMISILGTKVRIHHRSKGNGHVEIHYFSQEDLERLLELMRSIKQ